MTMRIHLDTDFGGDTDDACALAFLLGAENVELVGVTTTIDFDGLRAAYVQHMLELAGTKDVPVAAGAALSMTTLKRADPVRDDARHWPLDIAPLVSPPGAALDLLFSSIESGATVVGIGPYSNLALLELTRPGTLARARLVLMGGSTRRPGSGFPSWGPAQDFNVQWDVRAAEIVFEAASDLTLATLEATMKAHVRSRHLERLRAAGELGRLLASQSEAHRDTHGFAALAKQYPALPDDLLNFQWDPVTCAIAAGWSGGEVVSRRLRAESRDGILRLVPARDGQMVRLLTDVDGDSFAEVWLTAIERAAQQAKKCKRLQ